MKKNIFKKIVASLATVAMAAGLFTVMPAEEAKAANVVNVTVQGEGAEAMAASGTLKLHMWGGYSTDWPGKAMTDNGDDTWSVKDITVTSALNLIVNNGSEQTGNIEGVNVDKKDIYLTIAADKSVTVTYGTEDAPQADPDAGKSKKEVEVYVKLADELAWTAAYFHHWETGLAGTPGWPGIELTLSDEIYTGTIEVEESVTAIKGIVNNNAGVQTANIEDISVATGKIYITVKADKSFEVATSKPASWVDDSTQSSQATQSTGETDTKGNTETTTAADKTTTKAPETTTEAKKGIEVEVTLSADAKWDKVFIYAFPEGEGLKGWPGVEMTAKDGKWYATLDTTATKLSYVISNGNGEQTVDVKDVEGKNVKITLGAKNAEGKFEASAKAVTAGGTGSAKPGDAAPIVMMFAVAAVAAGMVVASKKKTICE